MNKFSPGHWSTVDVNIYPSEQLLSYVIPRERSVVIVQYFNFHVVKQWFIDPLQLTIDPQAQGPSSVSSSHSYEFSPSVSQVWSPTLSLPDCGPLSEFCAWEPHSSSQISQFVDDLNYVPTDLAPESHEEKDTTGGNHGEQCKFENPDEDSLAFQEVSLFYMILTTLGLIHCQVYFPDPDLSQVVMGRGQPAGWRV